MKLRDKHHAILATALGALLIYQGAAKADDTAEEIRFLKAKLRELEAKVNAQARKQKETQAQVKAVAAQPVPVAAVPAAAPVGIAVAPLGGYPQHGLTATESAVRGLPVAGAPSLYINGVSITPGGFFALESVYRQHFIGADIGTPYQNMPYGNVRSGYANEFRFTARQSRVSVLVKGDPNPTTHLSGYGEFDFLGAAQTANSNESNSFQPRVRHLYAALDQDDFGLHLLAGQNWSLLTMNTKGIMPRQEDIPLTIDAQYVPGFAWARQPQARLAMDFFDKTVWGAISAENPQTTFGCTPTATTPPLVGCTPAGPFVAGLPTAGAAAALPPSLAFNVPSAVGGSLFNSVNPISLNNFPDIIGKVAWEPTIADRTIHMEAFGLFRSFYSRINGANTNVAGGGFGGSILVPVLPKVLDFQFSGMTGRGIGRYGTAQLPDVAFNSDGTIAPIQETMLLAGLIWHAVPGLDLYTYAGQELEGARYNNLFTPAGVPLAYGYGNPLFTNAGCNIEGSTVCNGNVRLVRQITGGFWDKLYDGPFGSLRAGLQYSFTQKYSFVGTGGIAKAQENMFLTSLRYYPFQ